MTALLRLPDDLRDELKEPMGELFTDAEALAAAAGDPLVAVGDVVTYHLERAGRPPDVSLVDERTQRGAVDEEVLEALGQADVVVENPAATLTEPLVVALVEALEAPDPVRVLVDGEEDLAALPAVLAAPDGASVVYGQSGEGMVLVRVDDPTRERVRRLLARFDGDVDRLFALLEASPGGPARNGGA